MSLFGATQTKPSLVLTPPSNGNTQSSGGLFGQPQQTQQQNGGGLFGQSSQSAQQPSNPFVSSSSLFSQPQQQQQQQQNSNPFGGQQNQSSQGSGGLFGQPQQQPSTSLFGQPQQQQQQQPSNGLFGQPQQQQQQPSNSLFGQPQQQQSQPTSSLFGQPQQQQQQNASSLFQQPQQQSSSLFGGSQTQNQNQSQQLTRSIWQPGQMPQPREKTVPEQMQTLMEKWSPESPTCMFQRYFYNIAAPGTVPYYGPGPGEDEAKWEEALSKKPAEDLMPTLCKGFAAMGHRLRTQVRQVDILQIRLHEINKSLTESLQKHDLDITVRTNEAKRKHIVLSHRCLNLATKIQVLKSRGYSLDGPEERLKSKLQELEKAAFDPRFHGRSDEIWARMEGLRQRTEALHAEMEKLGKNGGNNSGEAIDEDVLKKTKKILGNYDSQITHLGRELDATKKDFRAWETDAGQA